MNWQPETANPDVGSFMPYLKWAVEHTVGPLLELGGGYFSSPYLHDQFRYHGRPACTYEFDGEWARELGLRFDQPIVQHFDELPKLSWDVVLIDCEGWNRREFLERLRPVARVFVVHDSQDPWVPEEVLNSFEYRADRDANPRTTLVSDVIDVRRAP